MVVTQKSSKALKRMYPTWQHPFVNSTLYWLRAAFWFGFLSRWRF